MLNKLSRLSATAVLLAVPAIASAQTIAYGTTAPVALSSYIIHESDISDQNGDAGERPHYVASGLTLDFVNRSDVAATGVTFLVTDGKYAQRIVDKGFFAQGISIVHTFGIEDGPTDADNAVVSVADVDFANGGTWRAQVVKTVAYARAARSNATSMPIPVAESAAAELNEAETQRLFRHLGTSL